MDFSKPIDTISMGLPIVYFKGVYICPIEIIKGLTDKGQFQYLTGFKGHQERTYL